MINVSKGEELVSGEKPNVVELIPFEKRLYALEAGSAGEGERMDSDSPFCANQGPSAVFVDSISRTANRKAPSNASIRFRRDKFSVSRNDMRRVLSEKKSLIDS